MARIYKMPTVVMAVIYKEEEWERTRPEREAAEKLRQEEREARLRRREAICSVFSCCNGSATRCFFISVLCVICPCCMIPCWYLKKKKGKKEVYPA